VAVKEFRKLVNISGSYNKIYWLRPILWTTPYRARHCRHATGAYCITIHSAKLATYP